MVSYDVLSIDRRKAMEKVRISPKYQIVIPKSVRVALDLIPGQDVEMIAHGDRIEVIPVRPLRAARGFLKGIDTTVEREIDRA
jgi:AbrB family looped-hinge helix DNA binding protein